MLDTKLVQRINDFVYKKPRTIQEISLLLNKNWRTADRYVQKIIEDTGSLSLRTFREGTRGALKIVYWNNIEKIHSSAFQERLFTQIISRKNKGDFSPSEIYQFVDDKKKQAKIFSEKTYATKKHFDEFVNELRSATSQLLFFSGNLTFSTMSYHDKKIRDIMEELSERNITSKVLTRVELAGIKSVKDLLAINQKIGRDLIEIRHCYQPLRLTIFDNKMATFKEVLDPEIYEPGELKERLIIIYYIYDEEWIEWLQKVFWHLFRVSVDAKRRIQDFKTMKVFK